MISRAARLLGPVLLVGAVAAACLVSVRQIVSRLGRADPQEVLAVHGAPALWGTLAVGLFRADGGRGLLYGGSMDGLVVQLVGIMAIASAALAAGLVVMALLALLRRPRRMVSQHGAKARG